MRILISSHVFWPSIGGIEQVTGILATEWTRLGHEVTVLTSTPAAADRAWPFTVLRRPRGRDTMAAFRRCDIYFQNHISLRTLWPAALIRRPVVVTYQTWLTRTGGRCGWQDAVKRCAARGVSRNVAISRAIAQSLPGPSTIIPNPYDDDVFRIRPAIPRRGDLIVVARLVSDKGVDLCLRALALLSFRGLRPRLTVVGIGPEEGRLKALAATHALGPQIDFLGRAVTGDDLSALLNAHRLLVIPSRWDEPFGIVALEGLACGCEVLGSGSGGLPETLGPSGFTFTARDANALADAVASILSAPRHASLPECARQHLRAHGRRKVANAYLHLFHQLCAPPPERAGGTGLWNGSRRSDDAQVVDHRVGFETDEHHGP